MTTPDWVVGSSNTTGGRQYWFVYSIDRGVICSMVTTKGNAQKIADALNRAESEAGEEE